MTEKEAIKELHDLRPRGGIIPQRRAEMIDVAIKALEEIQHYRAAGTVEEVEQNARDLKRQIEHSEHLAEVLKSTQNLLRKREQMLKDYCKIGTVEECRAAREKQKPKKHNIGNDNGRKRKCCSSCGCFYAPTSRYCPKCGQAIDWSEEE